MTDSERMSVSILRNNVLWAAQEDIEALPGALYALERAILAERDAQVQRIQKDARRPLVATLTEIERAYFDGDGMDIENTAAAMGGLARDAIQSLGKEQGD